MSFGIIFFFNLVINIDHGVMPAGAIVIKEYVDVSNTEYGLLGSVVFAGLVLGSLAATIVYNNVQAKYVLMAVMALNAVTQLAFTMTKEYYYLVTSRFLTGFFQVFISIYWPVWTDLYGQTEKRKAAWMSAFLAASPIGVLFGYVLTTQLIIYYSWQYAFYVQAVAVGCALLLIIIVPGRYFSLKKRNTSVEDGDLELNSQDPEAQSFSARPQNSVREQMRRSSTNRDVLGQSYDTDQLDALFESEADFDGSGRVENIGMTPTTPNIERLQNELENESTLRRIVELLKNGQFCLLTLSISSLYFVVTGLQYWVSAYLMITM